MAKTTRRTSLDETPIKHTAGGEMPDPTEQHHVSADELEALGGVEGEMTASNFMDQAKSYLPAILGAIGIGAGIYFLVKKYNKGELQGEAFDRIKTRVKDRLKNRLKNRMKSMKEEDQSESVGAEGQRALDVDDVPPTRFLGT